MKYRTNFIKDTAKKIYEEWGESRPTYKGVEECLQEAIELGMENHNLVDESYSFTVVGQDGAKYRFTVYLNTYCIMQSGYIFVNEENAREAAKAIIRILDGE